MSKNKIKFILILAAVLVAAGVLAIKISAGRSNQDTFREVMPVRGSIVTYISTTGTILPKNRLEIKPPVNGRIERILVSEGEKVKVGHILAWMSSTERAALIDAARGKGDESLKYWEETYKPIPLPAPIDGEVIVATTQPGQTVTTADAVVVLSDRLIVRAQVDETDIGKITPEKRAVVSLDAYPDVKIKASVEHIYHESKTVNNVTIYEVDLLPEETPKFFRSGMNATIDFVDQDKENILVIPVEAVRKEKEGDSVLVKKNGAAEPEKRMVKLGVSDDKNVEVISGVGQNETVIIKGKKYALPKSSGGTNPFMPARRR
jgi:membrane fusion protein, macrolide-specific efflux system